MSTFVQTQDVKFFCGDKSDSSPLSNLLCKIVSCIFYFVLLLFKSFFLFSLRFEMTTKVCFSTPLHSPKLQIVQKTNSLSIHHSFSSTTSRRQRSCKLYNWTNELSKESVTETSSKPNQSSSYRLEVIRSIKDISKQQWDELACLGCASPFLRHDWLRCLEEANCASVQTGWLPHHILLRNIQSTQIVALAPAYIKQHSLGEFVFDQEWAEAAYAAGISYYPKLLLAIPFTPATGRRILTSDDESRQKLLNVMAKALVELCHALGVSSVHVNFCLDDEMKALAAAGFLHRKGVQYHFTNYRKGQAVVSQLEENNKKDHSSNIDNLISKDVEKIPYISFEDYLSEFKSKKRIKMRRERNIVRNESGLSIQVIRGTDITPDLMDQMFHIYKSTIDKLLYGRQYLTLRFFNLLSECDEFKNNICLVIARDDKNGQVVGGTFNVIGNENGGAFYGRYWGCVEEIRYLHFEVCYYAAIEYCIENGISRMEPGAGGGDFKYMRGFEPSETISMHYLQDKRLSNAVARYLDMETLHIDVAVSEMKKSSAIRSKANNEDPSTNA